MSTSINPGASDPNAMYPGPVETTEPDRTDLEQRAENTPDGAAKRRSPWRWIVPFLVPLAILVAWQAAASLDLLNTQLFPAPTTVFERLWALTVNGVLPTNLGVSVLRALAGLVCGAGLGLIVGLLVGYFRATERTLDPMLQALRTVPLIAVTPLFILWFGFGEESKIILVAVGAFFPIYVNAFLGVRGVDRKLFDVADTLGFTWWQRLRLVVLPGALPNILLGLRLSIGMAWLCLVVAELMGATSGVGYLIQNARSLLDTATVMVGILIFAAVGKLSDSLVRFLERRLLRWRDTFSG